MSTDENIKFTPGPWLFYAAVPSTDTSWHIVTTANKMHVLANVHIEPGNEMDAANARLIAAAPDLYTALKYAEEMLVAYVTTHVGVHHEALAKARAALAKVAG